MTNDELIEKIASTKSIQRQIDILFDEIDTRLEDNNEFQETNELFVHPKVAFWGSDLRVALLSVTLGENSKLPSREGFLIASQLLYRDRPQLFKGFEQEEKEK